MMLAYDKHSLNSVRHYDENGFLHVDICNITKEQVAPYYGREIPGWQQLGLIPDKIYYGYRPFEEIKKAAETFNNLPLLSKHVEDGADKKNHHLRVGSLGTNAQANEPYLTNSLVVYDDKAIKGIETKEKTQLSSAYRYVPVFIPGFFDGQRYDFRMEKIRGNHVALVKEGRAGGDVVVADSNSIKKGEKMSTKLKNFISKLSSKKGMAMDEDLEEALKEAIREEVKEIVPEVKVEEEITEDAESVDKRKLIDEIGGILKGKIDEELWRTVIGKAEKLAYNDSTASADDAEIQAKDKCAKDVDFAEGVKYGEEMEKKERKKLDREHESEGAKAAMDANSIRLSIMNEFKQKNEAAQSVRSLIGQVVDPMAFDSAEDIYGKALELNGYNIKDYARSSYRGMVEVLKKTKSEKSGMSFDGVSAKSVLEQFPELGKVKLGAY